MNKVALVLNYDVLGGAEKSALEQRDVLTQFQIDIFYPNVNDKTEIKNATSIPVPKSFFLLTRKGGNNYLKALMFFFVWLFFSPKIKVKNYNILWFNGLKVFLLYLPIVILQGYKGKVIFHLRDYVSTNLFLRLALRVVTFMHVNLEVIANSKSVAKDFKQKHPNCSSNLSLAYNPYMRKSNYLGKKGLTFKMATASMLTAWKGIHVIILFTQLYRKDLLNLGVTEFSIYGDAIYKTAANTYKEEIQELAKGDSFIKFRGMVHSEDIFNSSDILIHSSLEKEPFGRVILEAFASNSFVLSTGLGGASELFDDDTSLYEPYDYKGLYGHIENFYRNSTFREMQLKKQNDQYDKFQKLAVKQIRAIFESYI